MENRENENKKKSNLFVRFVSAVMLIVMASTAGYVGKTVGRRIVGGRNTKPAYTHRTEDKAPEIAPQAVAADSRFDKLLKEWNVTHEPRITDCDTAVFAHETEDGLLEIIEVGYRDDIVQEMVNVIYYDVSAMTEEEKMQIMTGVMNLSVYYGQWDFVTVEFEETEGFFRITLDMKHLEKPENVQGLVQMGMAQEGAQELRMSLTEANFLLLGYYDK